jgi:hypothetical protein
MLFEFGSYLFFFSEKPYSQFRLGAYSWIGQAKVG